MGVKHAQGKLMEVNFSASLLKVRGPRVVAELAAAFLRVQHARSNILVNTFSVAPVWGFF